MTRASFGAYVPHLEMGQSRRTSPFPPFGGTGPLAFNSLAILLFENGLSRFLCWLFWSVDGRFLDLLDVENILFPARSQFVLDQVFP